MTTSQLAVKLLVDHAVLPKKGSQLAAGYDLAASEDSIVPARGRELVPTGLSIRVPSGTYGRVAPRSGLALKVGIDVGAGVIDEDYSGEVGVILFNHGDKDFNIRRGDRIAQLILEKIDSSAPVVKVDSLSITERGSAGFGSTGLSASSV